MMKEKMTNYKYKESNMNNLNNLRKLDALERMLKVHHEWINLNTKYVLILALFNLIYTSLLVYLVLRG